MMERQTKGIWIPIEIWEDENLSWNEKILFMEIDSFTSADKDCFFSNEYIAKLLKCTETSANRVLSSLIKKGYVIKTKFDGRHRFVKTAFSFNNSQSKADLPQKTRQGCHKRQGRLVSKDNIINTNSKPSNNHRESKEENSHSNFVGNENDTNEIRSVEEKSRLQDKERENIQRERKGVAPTLKEITDYWKEKNYQSNPGIFSLYYDARGWEGITNWKALADLWEMRERSLVNVLDKEAEKRMREGEKERNNREYQEYLKEMGER